jgi:hypothetical protein
MQRQVCIANAQAIAKTKAIIANLKGDKKIIYRSLQLRTKQDKFAESGIAN